MEISGSYPHQSINIRPSETARLLRWKDRVLDSSASTNASYVALILLDFMGGKKVDVAWPSIADISSRSKLCERSVQRGIRELERLGFIHNERPGGGLHYTGMYRIQVPK